jgi:hypothetical protein
MNTQETMKAEKIELVKELESNSKHIGAVVSQLQF